MMSLSLGLVYLDALQRAEPKMPPSLETDRRRQETHDRTPLYLIAAIVVFHVLWWVAMLHAPNAATADLFLSPSP